jgi:hypothetical protein
MTDSQPVACSLGADDLQKRLAAIAKIGADNLTDRKLEDGCHVLRFSADAEVRKRLGEIVAAERECCSFLDLALVDDAGELVLTIGAPDEARPVADDLALAFAGGRA